MPEDLPKFETVVKNKMAPYYGWHKVETQAFLNKMKEIRSNPDKRQFICEKTMGNVLNERLQN
jgi:hypothetical protein